MRKSCIFVDDLQNVVFQQMEATIAQQTKELMQTKEKLASHDAAAKRAVQTLQVELKKRVDEVSSRVTQRNGEN